MKTCLSALLAFVVCMVCVPASAQSSSTPTGTVSSASPALKMHADPSKIGVLEDIVVKGVLVNETPAKITIRGARICFPADFVRARGGSVMQICKDVACPMAPREGETGEVSCNNWKDGVLPGKLHPVTHVDVAPMNPLKEVSRYPALFMWTERSTRIEMHVDYSGADAQRHTISGEISVQTVASLFLLVLGTWVGAGLLAVFSVVHARRQGGNEVETLASHALRLFLAGGVTGTIFVLLIQRIGDQDLPFKFAVNDMLGGVIVGLLSFKIGDALYKYFFVSKP